MKFALIKYLCIAIAGIFVLSGVAVAANPSGEYSKFIKNSIDKIEKEDTISDSDDSISLSGEIGVFHPDLHPSFVRGSFEYHGQSVEGQENCYIVEDLSFYTSEPIMTVDGTYADYFTALYAEYVPDDPSIFIQAIGPEGTAFLAEYWSDFRYGGALTLDGKTVFIILDEQCKTNNIFYEVSLVNTISYDYKIVDNGMYIPKGKYIFFNELDRYKIDSTSMNFTFPYGTCKINDSSYYLGEISNVEDDEDATNTVGIKYHLYEYGSVEPVRGVLASEDSGLIPEGCYVIEIREDLYCSEDRIDWFMKMVTPEWLLS